MTEASSICLDDILPQSHDHSSSSDDRSGGGEDFCHKNCFQCHQVYLKTVFDPFIEGNPFTSVDLPFVLKIPQEISFSFYRPPIS
jgi:hypothetical protein